MNADKFGSGVHEVIETPCIQLLCGKNRILCAMALSVAKAKGNDMGNDMGYMGDMVNGMGGILPWAIYHDIVEIGYTDIVHGDTLITIR